MTPWMYYSPQADALQHGWAGARVWCHPPRRVAGAFLQKFWSEWRADPWHTEGVFLVPAWTSASWWTLTEGMREVARFRRDDGPSPFSRSSAAGLRPLEDGDMVILHAPSLGASSRSSTLLASSVGGGAFHEETPVMCVMVDKCVGDCCTRSPTVAGGVKAEEYEDERYSVNGFGSVEMRNMESLVSSHGSAVTDEDTVLRACLFAVSSLGCSKCRYSPRGCAVCRAKSYKPSARVLGRRRLRDESMKEPMDTPVEGVINEEGPTEEVSPGWEGYFVSQVETEPEEVIENEAQASRALPEGARELVLPCEEEEWKPPDLLALFREAYEQFPVESDETIVEGAVLRFRRRIENGSETFRVIVPKCRKLREGILRVYHDSPLRVHPGERALVEELRRDFEWHGLRGDVDEWVKTCDVCNRCKANQKGQNDIHPLPVASAPLQRFGMDYITSLPETARGHDAILVVTDYHTKKVRAVALRKAGHTAEDFARIFSEQIQPALGGYPQKLVCDRDPLFMATKAQAFFETHNVHVQPSSGGWPRTNGLAERMNRAVETALRLFTSQRQHDWDSYLQTSEDAINHSIHSATGFAPSVLATGVTGAPSILTFTGESVPGLQQTLSQSEGAFQHLGVMGRAWRQATEALERARQAMLRFYRRTKRRFRQYEPGQRVWLSWDAFCSFVIEGNESKKLNPRWYGPFEVEAVIDDSAVRLRLPASMRCHPVFNVSFVRPALEPQRFRRRAARPPPELEEGQFGEPEWVVGELLESRRVHGREEIRVQWRGYGREDDSWEPAHKLREDVPEMVQRFEESYVHMPDKRKAKNKAKRTR